MSSFRRPRGMKPRDEQKFPAVEPADNRIFANGSLNGRLICVTGTEPCFVPSPYTPSKPPDGARFKNFITEKSRFAQNPHLLR